MNKNIKQKKSKNLKPQKKKKLVVHLDLNQQDMVIGKKKVFVMTFNQLVNSILN